MPRLDLNTRLGLGTTASAFLVVWIGCASVRHEPFAEFTASARELRDGADQALAFNYDWSRERFIDETADATGGRGGEEAARSLLLDAAPGDPFGVKTNREPLFIASRRFRDGIFAANTVLVSYADLLAQLASPAVIPPADFERMAEDLNANLRSAAGALRFDVDPEQLEMLSTLASEALRRYLEQRRRGHLREAIQANQGNIEELSAHLRAATRLAAQHLRQEYDNRSGGLVHRIPEARDRTGRRKLIEDAVELNEQYIGRLNSLRTLHEAYAALPSAHRELAAVLEEPELRLTAVGDFLEYGQRLHRISRELQEKSPAE